MIMHDRRHRAAAATTLSTLLAASGAAAALLLPSLAPAVTAAQPPSGAKPAANTGGKFVYPPAQHSSQSDIYHGISIPDPFRPLEDADTPDSRRWIEDENALTRSYLAAVPQRDAIRARIEQLWNFEKFGVPFKEGGHYFFTHNSGLQNQAPLYILDKLDGQKRPLLDTNPLKKDGTMAIAGLAVTDDGKFLAYGLSDAGSDWETWKVRDVATGQDLPEQLDWVKFSGASWLKDGSGFFYSRFDQPAGQSLKAENYCQKLYYHARGTPQSDDILVYSRSDEKDWGLSGSVTDDGRYLVVSVSKGSDPKNRVFVRDLQKDPVTKAAAPSEPDKAIIATEAALRSANELAAQVSSDGELAARAADMIKSLTAKRATLIKAAGNASRGFVELLNNFGATYDFIDNDGPIFWFFYKSDGAAGPKGSAAPRGKVIAIDLNHPARESWKELIPEGKDSIQSVTCVGNHFLVSYLHDARTVVSVFDLSGAHARDIELPGIGTATGFGGKRKDPETFYSFTGFTSPAAVYRYDVATGKSEVFRQPKLKFNPDDYETTQVFYTSKDGARIPMFITARKGLKRSGDTPTVLYGYGGFNIPITPTFSPANLTWMEMGGIYAVANIRGGGEYGEEWHQAGTKLHKQNVFDDFIAAAEYLIKEKYTSTPKLAIHGGSNGGLLVGACMTQRPDLFGAAIPAVGVLDMLRFNKFTIGHAWMSDYGDPDHDEAQFKALHAYSPYHNIKAGTCYPATLITTGDHDDRVFPAHSFKFAAALQESQAQVAGCDKPILIRIETNAGHGAGKPTAKILDERADMWAFLVRALNMNPTLPSGSASASAG